MIQLVLIHILYMYIFDILINLNYKLYRTSDYELKFL
jgi:hypothetical protein